MTGATGLYPISLRAERVRALVVGGGPVGTRKIRGLLRAGIGVVLVAPEAVEALAGWAEQGRIEWCRRSYVESDLDGVDLVFAATDRRSVNRVVAQQAMGRGLLVNVADAPAEGNFHVPALCEVDEMLVAVSSRAGRPRQAQALRDHIKQSISRSPDCTPVKLADQFWITD